VEYSNEQYGYKKHGYLVRFKTHMSHVLNAEKTGFVQATIIDEKHGEIHLDTDTPIERSTVDFDDTIMITDEPIIVLSDDQATDKIQEEYQIIT